MACAQGQDLAAGREAVAGGGIDSGHDGIVRCAQGLLGEIRAVAIERRERTLGILLTLFCLGEISLGGKLLGEQRLDLREIFSGEGKLRLRQGVIAPCRGIGF